jgi:Ser/Thr protein kinase RdoA (MazF antagonist)
MDLFRFDPPDLTERQVRAVAHEKYGISGATQRLRGERSHNTLFTTGDDRSVVLKIASASEQPATIDFQAQALVHLAAANPALPIARMIPALDGSLVPSVELDGRAHRMRLVTYLPGVPFDDEQVVSEQGLRSIGALMGSIATALAGFEHPAADGFMAWDIANSLALDDELWAGLGDDARPIVERARPRLHRAAETMRSLPRQVIHNDGHGGNLLRSDETSDIVTGLIDFGDVVRTVTVADIGVSGANLVPHQPDPIVALAALALGYHEHRPLSRAEIEALPDLVLTRLVLSTLLVEYQIVHAAHIADAVAAERPRLLTNLARWTDIDAVEAAERVARALD